MDYLIWIGLGVFIFFLFNLHFKWVRFLLIGKFRNRPKQPSLYTVASKYPQVGSRTAKFFAPTGITVSPVLMERVEIGAQKTIDNVRRLYPNAPNLSNVVLGNLQVAVMPSELSKRDRKPGIRIAITESSPWWGQPQDQGGYILVAGAFLGYNDSTPNRSRSHLIAIADPKDDMDYAELASEHECEHWGLHNVDTQKFLATTYYHQHPILDQTNAKQTFAAVPSFSIVLK